MKGIPDTYPMKLVLWIIPCEIPTKAQDDNGRKKFASNPKNLSHRIALPLADLLDKKPFSGCIINNVRSDARLMK